MFQIVYIEKIIGMKFIHSGNVEACACWTEV